MFKVINQLINAVTAMRMKSRQFRHRKKNYNFCITKVIIMMEWLGSSLESAVAVTCKGLQMHKVGLCAFMGCTKNFFGNLKQQ